MFCKILILRKVFDKIEEVRTMAEKVMGAQNVSKPVVKCQVSPFA